MKKIIFLFLLIFSVLSCQKTEYVTPEKFVNIEIHGSSGFMSDNGTMTLRVFNEFSEYRETVDVYLEPGKDNILILQKFPASFFPAEVELISDTEFSSFSINAFTRQGHSSFEIFDNESLSISLIDNDFKDVLIK